VLNILFIFFRIEKAKESLISALAKTDPEINYKDLERFFSIIKTDEELNLLLEGLKIYSSNQKDLRLSVPLMQLLYVLDKTDKALELFMDRVRL
jgi:hypothetical protein